MNKVTKSIRTKFLTVFIISIMVTLAVSMIVSYSSINSVYVNINKRIMDAEFSQISNDISTILSEADTLVTTSITNTTAIRQLADYEKISTAERTYAVNDLSREVMRLGANYPYLESVYLFVNQEWFLAMSRINTRQFRFSQLDWPSQRVMDVLAETDFSTIVTGGIQNADFPLNMNEPAYFMLTKQVLVGADLSTCIVNIKESEIFERYANYMGDGLRAIRIVNDAGVIVSSANKEEIGTVYEPLRWVDLTQPGAMNDAKLVTSYTPIDQYRLVIVNTLPVSIYTRELTTIRNHLLLIFGVSMVLVSLFFCIWIDRRLKPLVELQQGMKQAGQGDYSVTLEVKGNDELSELIRHFNMMLTDLEKLNENRKQAEKELREQELAALRNEINPHFLYNTLNNIKCLADLEGNKEISRCIVALGGIVAPLYKVKTPTWTLQEEVTLVQKYLDIMNIRYGNGIVYEEDIPETLLERQVMRLILQPIFENSILHGFADRCYSGTIRLTVREQDERLYLVISDNGSGMSEEELRKANSALQCEKREGSVGILNVSRRISLRCGSGYGLQVSAPDTGGLRTTICLPGCYDSKNA